MISASCFSIFEVEPPTSRSEQSERVARRGNRHGTTQTGYSDYLTPKQLTTVAATSEI